MKTMRLICLSSRVLFTVLALAALWQLNKSYTHSYTVNSKSALFAATNYVNEFSIVNIKADIEEMQNYLIREALYPLNTLWSPVTQLEVYLLPTVLRSGGNVIMPDDLGAQPTVFFYYDIVYDQATKKLVNIIQSLECNLAFVGVITQNHDPEFTDFAEVKKYHLITSEMLMRWLVSQNFEPFTDYNEQHYKNYKSSAWSYLELKSLYSYVGIYYFLHSCLINQTGHPTKQGDEFVFQGDEYISNNAVIAHYASKKSQLNIVVRFPWQALDYINSLTMKKTANANKIVSGIIETHQIISAPYQPDQIKQEIERLAVNNQPPEKRIKNSIPVNIIAQPLNHPLALALPTYNLAVVNISEIKKKLSKIIISPISIFNEYYTSYMLSTVKEHNLNRQFFALLYFVLAFLALEQCCRSYNVHKIIFAQASRLGVSLNFFLVISLYAKNFWRFLLPTSFKTFQTAIVINLEKFELNRLKQKAKKIWKQLTHKKFKKHSAARRNFEKIVSIENVPLAQRRESLQILTTAWLDWLTQEQPIPSVIPSATVSLPLIKNDCSTNNRGGGQHTSIHESVLLEVKKQIPGRFCNKIINLSTIQLQSLQMAVKILPSAHPNAVKSLLGRKNLGQLLQPSSELMQAVRYDEPVKICKLLAITEDKTVKKTDQTVNITGALKGLKVKVVYGKMNIRIKNRVMACLLKECGATACELICCDNLQKIKDLAGSSVKTVILLITARVSHSAKDVLKKDGLPFICINSTCEIKFKEELKRGLNTAKNL
ncbi:MAG: hypothetical protein Q8Q23_05920 [bacterium]|nr:hypothetical protein [bacterium]